MVETFTRDLKRGKFHEIYILNEIQKKYNQAYIIDGYCKDYDIYIPELEFGVEVKSDEKSKHTGTNLTTSHLHYKHQKLSIGSFMMVINIIGSKQII